MIIKYFYESTDEEYRQYNDMFRENNDRIIHLQSSSSFRMQLESMTNDILTHRDKDILAIHWPTIRFLQKNIIFRDLLEGKGIGIGDPKWFPKEIWIYEPEKIPLNMHCKVFNKK